MRPTAEKIESSPTVHDSIGVAISTEKYEAVRDAILAIVSEQKQGVLFMDLPAAVADRLPQRLLEGKALNWYTTLVKLDLEARGMLERVPGHRPQRLRRPSRQGG